MRRELDRQTLDSWLVTNIRTGPACGFLRPLFPAVFSAEAPEMSLLHFLFYIRSGGSMETLVATTGGAQEARVVGGSHEIARAHGRGARRPGLAQLPSVRTRSARTPRVRVVFEGGSRDRRRASSPCRRRWPAGCGTARRCPAQRDGLTQQCLGSVIKFQVGYDTPFWREDGLNGFVSASTTINVSRCDNHPEDASCGVLVGFLEGVHAAPPRG